MQFCREESYDTQDTLRGNGVLKHMATMELSEGDETVVSPQQGQHLKPNVWTPPSISVARTYSLGSTDGGFDSLNTTDEGFEVDHPADGLAGKDSLALTIVPKYKMTITPWDEDDETPIPRSSSRTIKFEKYWTRRRKRLVFLIATCLIIVVMVVCSIVLVGQKERREDRSKDEIAQANAADVTFTTAPSDPDVSFISPTAAPSESGVSFISPTATPSESGVSFISPTAAPTFAPTFFLQTQKAYRVLAPMVEDPTLLLIPDTTQGAAFQMIVDEQSTYNWTRFRIAQRYALMVLYLSSDGDAWNRNNGWGGFSSDECEWYGINTCRLQPHGERAVGIIGLNANNLVGSIPSEICLLNLVEKIHLSENEFQGKLPACIASMPSLNRFDADMNQLSGSLPTGPWPALESLTLSDNEFSGDLSSVSSSSMPFLRNLDVHNNQFTGGLPEGLFLKAVEKLDFSENQFSGRLYDLFLGLDGKGIFQAASTLLVLRLNDNLFQGDLVGQLFLFLGQLQELTLEGNLLTGSLETECARSLDKLTADCAHVDCSCCTECP